MRYARVGHPGPSQVLRCLDHGATASSGTWPGFQVSAAATHAYGGAAQLEVGCFLALDFGV